MSSYYRKESTYRHDYNRGKAPEFDRYGLHKPYEFYKSRFDDPAWQRGRNESQEQYEDRLREMSIREEPDYYRTYEERKAHEEPKRRMEHEHFGEGHGPHMDRAAPPSFDDPIWQRGRNESSEQYEDRLREMKQRYHMDRGRGYEDGSQTDRDGYNRAFLDRGNLTYRRYDRKDDPKYERYRPTQKDYGDFSTAPKLDNMPRPYRGQFDRQMDNFQNKVTEQNLSYDLTRHPIPPPHIDFQSTGNLEPVSKPESGVYLFIRTHKDGLADVRKSFQLHKTILSQSGHLTGIALPDRIKVTGDYNNWQLRKGPWYEDRHGGISEYHTDYIIVVLWFPSAKTAKTWVERDQDFKIASFPAPYGADITIIPINYIPPEDATCRTFLLTEYPAVKHPDYFRTQIIEPMRSILMDYHNCEPFVVRTNAVMPLRGNWLSRDDSIAVHRFSDEDEAKRFYYDPRATTLRGKLNGVTRGGRHTTVRFTITETI